MRLHDNHSGVAPVATALNGKKVSLLKVFTHSMKYLKEDAMEEINRSQVKDLRSDEVKWVITGMSFSAVKVPFIYVFPIYVCRKHVYECFCF